MEEIASILDKQAALLEQIAGSLRQPGDVTVTQLLQAVREMAARFQSVQHTHGDTLTTVMQEPAQVARETQRRLDVGNAVAGNYAADTSASVAGVTLPQPPPRAGLEGTYTGEGVLTMLAQLNQLGTELLQAVWSVHNKVQPGGAG
ncbi:MAG: hypothetical protein AB7K24_05710 [Gemmataceae bacterium]